MGTASVFLRKLFRRSEAWQISAVVLWLSGSLKAFKVDFYCCMWHKRVQSAFSVFQLMSSTCSISFHWSLKSCSHTIWVSASVTSGYLAFVCLSEFKEEDESVISVLLRSDQNDGAPVDLKWSEMYDAFSCSVHLWPQAGCNTSKSMFSHSLCSTLEPFSVFLFLFCFF